MAAISDRESTILGYENKSGIKEAYSTLYKKLQLDQSKHVSKVQSILVNGSPRTQFTHKNKSPADYLESPQVQLQSREQQTTDKKHDPVIRADLFGRYQEVDNKGSEYLSSKGFSGKNGSQQITFQRNSNSSQTKKQTSTDNMTAKHDSAMSWTGQYSQFIMQIEKMKKELETIGDENIELAHLITEN